jgi:hypothetical protein
MHPSISDAPNALIYNGLLVNAGSVSAENADTSLLEWYRADWGYDRPLLLIDTADFGAWNNKAGNSRLNFLSALLSVRLVATFLRPDRVEWDLGKGRRVFVITPYRPQAALIGLLLQDEEIAGEVQASTAHSCQGGQAELVIVDLTVDQPHFATNLTSTVAGTEIRRLLNVAMTRAKRRLLMIGNFSWLRSKGRGAFVGGELLPYLLAGHKPVPATDVWSSTSTSGKWPLLNSADLARELHTMVRVARRRLTILSPALALEVLERVGPELCALVSRGGEALLICRPLHEQNAARPAERPRLEEMLGALRANDVIVVHKSAMYEKLVLADERAVWSATVPPLAATDGSGWFETRGDVGYSRALRFHDEIWDCLGLEHVLIAAREHQLHCPVCSSQMWMADTGPKSDQPFYWKCAKPDCFTRGLKEPGVINGSLALACGGQPSLDYWGNDPVWVCDCGKHHRTRIKRAHLRLPKMWALVPKQRRSRLLRELGINAADFFQQGDLDL